MVSSSSQLLKDTLFFHGVDDLADDDDDDVDDDQLLAAPQIAPLPIAMAGNYQQANTVPTKIPTDTYCSNCSNYYSTEQSRAALKLFYALLNAHSCCPFHKLIHTAPTFALFFRI